MIVAGGSPAFDMAMTWSAVSGSGPARVAQPVRIATASTMEEACLMALRPRHPPMRSRRSKRGLLHLPARRDEPAIALERLPGKARRHPVGDQAAEVGAQGGRGHDADAV